MVTRQKVKFDAGYTEVFMPRRERMGNYSAEMMAGTALIGQPILLASYIHNGFARLVCDKPAEEMTRAGFKIKGLEESMVDAVEARLEELDAVKHFNTVLKWRRAFGGGLIVLGIDDGGKLSEPVNEDAVKGVEFMRVYDRYEAVVSTRYSDAEDPNYGQVELWAISPHLMGGQTIYVHESRVIVFDGEAVPNEVRVGNDGWGASVIQNAFKELTRLDRSHKFSLLLLERMQQAVHSIPNLSEQIDTKEGEELITKRLRIVDAVRGAMNTVTIDGEETYEIKSMTLSGVNEVMDRFAEAVSAVTNIPIYILMGRSVGGLNSTGKSSQEGWFAQVEAWQNDQLRKPLDRLITLLILADSEGSTDGDEYTLEFNPLSQPSDTEIATNNKVEAETLNSYIGTGVIDADEAREIIRDKFNLVGNAPEPEPEPEPILDPIKLKEGETLVPHPNAVPPVNVGK